MTLYLKGNNNFQFRVDENDKILAGFYLKPDNTFKYQLPDIVVKEIFGVLDGKTFLERGWDIFKRERDVYLFIIACLLKHVHKDKENITSLEIFEYFEKFGNAQLLKLNGDEKLFYYHQLVKKYLLLDGLDDIKNPIKNYKWNSL